MKLYFTKNIYSLNTIRSTILSLNLSNFSVSDNNSDYIVEFHSSLANNDVANFKKKLEEFHIREYLEIYFKNERELINKLIFGDS